MKKTRKSLAVVLAATMMCSGLSAMPMQATAAEISVQSVSEMDVEFDYYTNEDGGVEIQGYRGGGSELVIPEMITGKPVTRIISLGSSSAYSGLEKLVLPKTVEKISASALSNCNSLKEIVVDENNSNYATENGVLFNKDKTILICYPSAKTEVEYEIPQSVQTLETSVFKNCENIEKIIVLQSVNTLPVTAFEGCEKIKEIVVDEGNGNFTSENGVLFNKDKTTLICYPVAKPENEYEIPQGVVNIENSAFEKCQNLQSVTIPDSVTSIGNSAFSYCNYLREISIADSVTSVGKNAFENTHWLNKHPEGVVYAGKVAIEYKKGNTSDEVSVDIKDGTVYIYDEIFKGCKNIVSVTIPDSVTYLGNNAFYGCTNLAQVKLSASLTTIDYNTFYNCKSLSSVVIPDGVTAINEGAFAGCVNLTEVIIPDSVTDVGRRTFTSVPWYENQPEGIIYLGSVAYTYKGEMPENCSLEIKDGTKTIGYDAFYNQSNLVEITIPQSVSNIRTLAFRDCTALKQINLPEAITVIETGAFQGCTSLTEVVIPKNVTQILSSAFEGCSALKKITIHNGVEWIGMKAFYNCINLKSVTIPKSITMIQNAFGYYFEKGQGILKVEDFTIYGYADTEAEAYATSHEFNFVVLEDVKGDINNDTVADVKDVTTLQMHLASYDVEVNENALDVNGNSVIDVTDVTTLQMLLAGYEI